MDNKDVDGRYKYSLITKKKAIEAALKGTWTQRYVAQLYGVTPSTLFRWVAEHKQFGDFFSKQGRDNTRKADLKKALKTIEGLKSKNHKLKLENKILIKALRN